MTQVTFVLRKRNQAKPEWTDGEDARVIRLRKEGLTVPEIAEQFGNRTVGAISNRLWSLQQNEKKKMEMERMGVI